ncbi:MAG TPA: SDR family oxidoreductase [Myxococcota bacterium]|nr:SDR family oxidoreductase [Myxococcota bacterium]
MPLGPDDVRLTDRIALVTGAAVGIGAAIAETYARFGADLALCDRNAEALAETAERVRAVGRRVRTAVLDVRDGDAVNAFAAEVGDGWGHIDVLVNNAGGTFQAPFLEVSARGQEALVHENFTSVTHFVRAVVPRMPAGSGSIVNLTSIEAHRAGPGYAVYSAMKAAVENLSKSLALELGARGIRVNCIAPDVIPTPGIGPMEVRTPLTRAGHPDDVAGAALFLAGDLSRFVTGTTLHVDGGNFAAGGWRRRADGRFET